MLDFASDSRSEGERPGRTDEGVVTHDRKVKKDAYYWYRPNLERAIGYRSGTAVRDTCTWVGR